MMASRGVQVRLTRGTGTTVHYAAVGRSGSYAGIQHSKTMLMGAWLIHGSANWSTSTRGNHEFSTLTWLTAAGIEAVTQAMREMDDRGSLYHEAVRQSEHRAAARAASGTRTPSRTRRTRSLSPTR